MKWKSPEPRPYYSKYEKLDISNSKGWFEAYALPGDVYAICEPQHLQEVNAFLIFGEERALLLDTGMGICDIRPLVEELCQIYGEKKAEPPRSEMQIHRGGGMPESNTAAGTHTAAAAYVDSLQVVNCHCHFDHTGCNWRFREILGVDTALTRRQAKAGVAHGPLANQTDEDMFLFGYPEGFAPEEYHIRPYNFTPIADGRCFELGGRIMEFITTPGHTEDHAMLYDHREGILFAGDMIYFGAIYVQFGNDIMGHSNIEEYIRSLEKVQERCPDVKWIYVSHNDFITDPSAIHTIKEALKGVNARIRAESAAPIGQPLQDEKYGYYGDPPTMKEYRFDGFSIVAAG